jgi:hypothetical protein
MLIEPVTCLHNHQYDAEAFFLPQGHGVAPPLLPLFSARSRETSASRSKL